MISTFLLAAAQTMTFTADRIAADNVTHALAATGHIVAVSSPMTLRGESMSRSADGLFRFGESTCATTCTNAVGHTHWNVTGELEYKEKEYVLLRNAWLRFYEIPVFWLPYLYYPLETDCGFSWMPGYTGHWGGFLLTKYSYHLLGDPRQGEESWWLRGATRLDLRYQQGVAVGEDLDWNLGDFGSGGANVYFAWDEEAADEYGDSSWHNANWESPVDRERYSAGLRHRWEATERDVLRLQASVYSDSAFVSDYRRDDTFFSWQSQWVGYENSGVFWEHVENSFSAGGEVSGRLNEFYAMTDRLPEFYFDVNPQPVFGLPVNYESGNRIGYLRRNPAEYGVKDRSNVFAFTPGEWACYDSFRFDTYHRLTAPFRCVDDVMSVVPRVGYHGTFWDRSGEDDLDGWGVAETAGGMGRSIVEGGVTFAGRGTAWVNDKWRHMVEPYLDVLAQRAWTGGAGNRPYVFDAVDASLYWEDQFAGRSRNLPYSYYGVTPGLRNVWDRLGDRGELLKTVDLDVYSALQFGETSYLGENDGHKLAEVGKPNYGKNGVMVAPGARLKWTPSKGIALAGRGEYDSDNNRLALADASWLHRLSDTFRYDVTYGLRDYRAWDFSSTPYNPAQLRSDDFNFARLHYVRAGFEHQPLDWLAWGPYVRWDLRENELDGVGTWIDYLTDCLGFRFTVEYNNSYTRIDGYEREEDWSFGFYVYLRAFGPDSSNVFR